MKKNTLKRVMLLVLTAVMILATVGCGNDKETTAVQKGSGEIPEKLTIFAGIGPYTLKAGAQDNNDTLYFQLMEELTGCHVEWIHPASGAGAERFNLIIASGNLPDLMFYNWRNASGGIAMYVEDDIIIPLRDLIEENMPNLSKFLKENPHIAKQFANDDGEIYSIPIIQKDEELRVFRGPQIRQDWLEKLGLEEPETPEELYEVLKAFKTQDPNGNGKADEIPMSGVKFETGAHSIGNLLWQFGTANGFYVENGKVKYGVIEDAFEEGVRYIAKLYEEGLIDPDYLLNNRDKMDNKVLNDQVGFIYSLQPGNFCKSMDGSGRKVVGIKHPSAEGVENNVFDSAYAESVSAASIAVTTANKNPEGTLKWLDNFFSEKGTEIMNYGKEGLTFEYTEDGYPKFTDYIFNNPDGKSMNDVAGLSLGTYQGGFPAFQEWDYYEQILTSWGKESIEKWSSSANIAGVLPPVSFNEEENSIIATKMSQIETYVSEKVNKIIIGNAGVDELKSIREKVKKMGIDEVIEIYNNALKRYNDR